MFAGFNFKKYRFIIIAIMAFLVLVLGILGLNFYISFEAQAHAAQINVAARQRMLSERIAKSLFEAEAQFLTGEVGKYKAPLQELKESYEAFDEVLARFSRGGEIAIGESQGSLLNKIETPEGQKILEDTAKVWAPFKQEFANIQEQIGYFETASFDSSTISLLDTAVAYANENDSTLLELMNSLSAEAQALALDNQSLNLINRQQALSQQIIKALLVTTTTFREGGDFKPSLKELSEATELFDTTLLGIKTGEIYEFEDDEEPLVVTALSEKLADTIIFEALVVWKPLLGHIIRIENVMQSNGVIESDTRRSFLLATKYVEERFHTLSFLMNKLTIDIQQSSAKTANFSRRLQVAGILLALFIFAFIAYQFFGQLRVSDLKADRATRETQQILDTVDQGLFLMDQELIMGEQYSKEMEVIFADAEIAGRDFPSYIENIVSDKDAKRMQRFFKLLFDPHKKQKLLGDLNPLKQVSVQIKDDTDKFVNKYLRFSFSRINDEQGISKILTSVNDISEEVRLAMELERATKKNEQQVELLMSLMNSDITMLPIFIKNAYDKYENINQLLRSPASSHFDYKAKINRLMSLIHTVKGESAALSLGMVAEMCHDFERQLTELRDRPTLAGNDFLGLTVKLDQLLTYNNLMNDLYEKVFSPKQEVLEKSTKPISWTHLYNLSNDVATRQNKEISLVLAGLDTPLVDETMAAHLNTISIQLIRNSIVHGIESTHQRALAEKHPKGKISITLAQEADGGYMYLYKDDGQGIDLKKVVKRAIESGAITEKDVKRLSKKDAAKLILLPEISTSEQADLDGGRGAGMSAVTMAVEALGGKVSISSKEGKGTVFKIRFPNITTNPKKTGEQQVA